MFYLIEYDPCVLNIVTNKQVFHTSYILVELTLIRIHFQESTNKTKCSASDAKQQEAGKIIG